MRFLILLLVPSFAFAAEAELPDWLTQVGSWLGPIISGFGAKWPILATVVFLMGAFRVVFKPAFALLRSYVDYTPNPHDNVILDKVEKSVVYKAAVFALDWFASIKIGPVEKK